MAQHPAEAFVATYVGPLAVTRACKLCKFHHTRKRIAGGGRGSGMREGNKQRGILIQHVKATHPEALMSRSETL